MLRKQGATICGLVASLVVWHSCSVGLFAGETWQHERKAYLKKETESKQRALWESAIKGVDLYPMGYFKGVHADIRNEDGLTPLMLAVKLGHSRILDVWARDGVVVDVWAQDFEGRTAWDYIKKPTNRREVVFSNRMYMALRMLAIHQILGGNAQIVQSMSGIDRVKIWIQGASCRDFCFPKYVQCIESPKLDRNGSPVTVYEKDVKRGVPPLFAAIQNHRHETLEALLRSGEDLEQKNKYGTRPLLFAVYHHDIKSVKLLLEYGANPNVMDGNGVYTPLSEASMRNQIDTVKLLLSYGADVNYQHNKSETALMSASKGCRHFKMVKLLLEHGADPRIKDEFGYDTISGLSRYCNNTVQYRKMRYVLEHHE